ncbi:MAG: polysaccharide biosynthesis tyrosine autokinase [Desulfopila sp.]
MGNIANALKKVGIELVNEPQIEVQPLATKRSAEQPEAVEPENRPASVPTSRRDTPRLPAEPSEPWNERIQQVLSTPGPVAEAFRVLRSKILFPKDGKSRPKTIMVTSSAPEEGKSFVSVNLAAAIAKGLDQFALLVDCDLRRPSLADLLGMGGENRQGLTEYLQEDAELEDLIVRTAEAKLSLLPSGSPPQNPAELITSVRMSRLVNELSGRYSDRFIIFDSPPFQVASESLVLAKKVDGIVIVVGSGKSDRARIKEMIETIGREKILGVVFNKEKQGYIKKKMFDPYGGYSNYYSPRQKK